MLTWSDAERILRGGRFFWISTTDADGRPHLVQQWGAWVDGHLYFEGSERTHWAQNLARDPRVAFGTQTGSCAVFGQGTVAVVRGVEPAVAKRIASQYVRKYGRTFDYRPKPEQYMTGHVFRATPSKMIAFDVKHFTASGTRFTF
jgi:nitroimidazol reductase NimA-like FMN-containing flavoprotein (pyridoxamine 5'-phosphate oxidase superfamily)